MNKKRKLPVKGGMRVKTYSVLTVLVERAIHMGWNRSHKHTDKPDEFAVRHAMEDAVLGEICEYFEFLDDENN